MSNLSQLIKIFFLIVSFVFSSNLTSAEQINMNMNVSVQENENNFFLHVTLENVGTNEIKISEHFLPWMSSDNMRIFLVNATKRYELTKQMFSIDDPGVDVEVIEPGKLIEGKIDLRNYFPNLDLPNNRDELLFFWTYLLKPKSKNQESKRFGGFFTLQDYKKSK